MINKTALSIVGFVLVISGLCGGVAVSAAAAVLPIAEGVCLAGEPWTESGAAGCAPLSPSAAEMGRPVAVLTPASEHYEYVVEQAYSFNYGGGIFPTGTDTIVQLKNEGARAPQFVSCVSETTTPDCTQISNPAAIFEAQSAVISPDAENIYVASFSGVARFLIKQSGAVEYKECVGLEGGACADPPGALGTEQTVQMAISPDGRDLYTVAEGGLREFPLAADGAITSGECRTFRDGCSSPREEQERSGSVAVTPSGKVVLDVVGGDQVNVYQRLSDGSLMFAGCLGDTYCPGVGAASPGLSNLQSIVIAPNGRDVYVTGGQGYGYVLPHAIAHLRLTTEDTLEFVNCYGSEVPGCEPLPPQVQPFGVGGAAKRLAMNPAGTKLAIGESAVGLFDVNSSTGDLSWEGCVGRRPSCEPGEGESIAFPGSVEFTPNGDSVWIADPEFGLAGRMDLDSDEAPAGELAPDADDTTIRNLSSESAEIIGYVNTYELLTTYAFALEDGAGEVEYRAASANSVKEGLHVIEPEDGRLKPGESYRARLVAINEAGTGYGPWTDFQTTPCGYAEEVPVMESFRGISSTGTTISAAADIETRCDPTTLRLEVGPTESYGHVTTIPSSALPVDYADDPFYVEVAGLQPETAYDYRLIASSGAGTAVLTKGQLTTGAQFPARQVAVRSGASHAVGKSAVTLEGLLTAGDSGVALEAQIYEQPEEPDGHMRTVALGAEPAGRQPITVTGTVDGLECGHAYEWDLAARAPYGESVGARRSFTLPCTIQTPPAEPPVSHEPEPVIEETPIAPIAGKEAPADTAPADTDLPAGVPAVPLLSTQTTGAGASAPRLAIRIERSTISKPRDGRVTVRTRVRASARGEVSVALELTPPRQASRHAIILAERTVRVSGEELLTLEVGSRSLDRAVSSHRGWKLVVTVAPLSAGS